MRVPGYRSRGFGFDSRCYQIFWEVVGLERGPLSLVNITEELFERKSSGSESRISRLTAGIRCADHATPSIRKKLAPTSPTSGGSSVGIVRLSTKATEIVDSLTCDCINLVYLYLKYSSFVTLVEREWFEACYALLYRIRDSVCEKPKYPLSHSHREKRWTKNNEKIIVNRMK
jgi:hypothetical protein